VIGTAGNGVDDDESEDSLLSEIWSSIGELPEGGRRWGDIFWDAGLG